MKLPVHCLALICLTLTACAGGNVPNESAATESPAAATTAAPAAAATPPAAAAAPKEAVLAAAPEGSRWRLVESTVAGLEGGSSTGIRIEFVDGRLAGDSGCNRFSAPVTFSGETMALGISMSSKRGCPDGRGAVERSLYDALPSLNRAVMIGDRLRLDHTDGGWMLFETDPTVAE